MPTLSNFRANFACQQAAAGDRRSYMELYPGQGSNMLQAGLLMRIGSDSTGFYVSREHCPWRQLLGILHVLCVAACLCMQQQG